MPDIKTQVFDNAISPDLLAKVDELYVRTGMTYGWKANKNRAYDQGHWNRSILRKSEMFLFDQKLLPAYKQHPLIAQIWNQLQDLIGDWALVRAYVNGYTYGTDSYAHRDDTGIVAPPGEEPQTAIVYLNSKWDKDWAGETVIFSEGGEIEASVLPKHGRLLSFRGDKFHAARPLSRICPVLRTVLVFQTGPHAMNDPIVTALWERTRDIKHGSGTFFDHLYSTARVLEQQKQIRDVCLAGLFHAVYGTEFFDSGRLFKRDELRALIGEHAENLVWLFCNLHDRYKQLMDPNMGEPGIRDALARIEIANLSTQNGNGRQNAKIAALRATIQPPVSA